VEPLGGRCEAGPVGVGPPVHHLALLEQDVEGGLQVERVGLVAGPGDEVLEVDEEGDALVVLLALHGSSWSDEVRGPEGPDQAQP